jgi:hypothetical protein
MTSHADIDRRNLAMARAIAARIDADPERTGLTHARAVCARWVAKGVGPAAEEWQRILAGAWEHVREVLLDESEEGDRLRQNSPFCGILSSRERWTFYRREGAHAATRT